MKSGEYNLSKENSNFLNWFEFKITNNSLAISKITFYFKNLKVFSFYTLAFFYRLTSLSEKESAFIHVGKKVISKSI